MAKEQAKLLRLSPNNSLFAFRVCWNSVTVSFMRFLVLLPFCSDSLLTLCLWPLLCEISLHCTEVAELAGFLKSQPSDWGGNVGITIMNHPWLGMVTIPTTYGDDWEMVYYCYTHIKSSNRIEKNAWRSADHCRHYGLNCHSFGSPCGVLRTRSAFRNAWAGTSKAHQRWCFWVRVWILEADCVTLSWQLWKNSWHRCANQNLANTIVCKSTSIQLNWMKYTESYYSFLMCALKNRDSNLKSRHRRIS